MVFLSLTALVPRDPDCCSSGCSSDGDRQHHGKRFQRSPRPVTWPFAPAARRANSRFIVLTCVK